MIPPNVEWLSFPEPDLLARAAATRWMAFLKECPDLATALPGGRIGRAFLEAVGHELAESAALARRAWFFFGDERCVPPEDPESNYRQAREAFLDPAGIPPEQVVRIRGEIAPDQAAKEASAALERCRQVRGRADRYLDLVILGMGEDGHVASLFPGTPAELAEAPVDFVAVVGPKPPPRRVSLTFGALVQAHAVWVLISGGSKADALRASLVKPPLTPLGQVLMRRRQTVLFTDRASAGSIADGRGM